MLIPIINVNIRSETDTVAARQRARQIARLLGFDAQDQTRIGTAVSEIARNAFRYAGAGKAEYGVDVDAVPPAFVIRVIDQGPGIADLERVLDGSYSWNSTTGMGILGARRLMDHLEIDSQRGVGTTVTLVKSLPRKGAELSPAGVSRIADVLASEKPRDALAEVEQQNQELIRTLTELRKRQEDLTTLNRELEDTNRGVVALYAELDEKADHLRRADELKSKFLSNMSHEFRSPLNSILALSRLLLDQTDGPLNAEQSQQVGFIQKAANDLYELVNDLLDLAKVEAGKVEVKPAEFTVSNLFGALRGMLRPLFLNQSLNLVFEAADDLPPLSSDEGKISQILRNFISNALKFTERGEVRVSARIADRDQIVFSVADTGIGIAPEDQDRIFQDFAQLENPIQKRVKGTGLGLPLSRKLAHLLGGEVYLVSELGLGSTFSVSLPLIYQKETRPAPAVAPEDGKKAVLVVENSEETVLLYRKWLDPREYQVIAASSVTAAREVIATVHPALIVLDILLRGEMGWDVLDHLKRLPASNEIPVLVASTIDDVRKAYHLGAAGCLVKPIDPQRFRDEVRRLTSAPRPDRVLIIDDNDRDRYLLKHWLRDANILINEATSGEEGLSRARHDRPSLIFLDLSMPDMSGFEVLDKLKSDPLTSSIAVVVHTSMRLSDPQIERLKDNAASVVSKEHFGRDEALAIVRQLVDNVVVAR